MTKTLLLFTFRKRMSYYCEKCKEQRTQGCFGPRCPGIPKHADGESLPALPQPARTMWQHGKQIDHYSAEQMRAYARQARAQAAPVQQEPKS